MFCSLYIKNLKYAHHLTPFFRLHNIHLVFSTCQHKYKSILCTKNPVLNPDFSKFLMYKWNNFGNILIQNAFLSTIHNFSSFDVEAITNGFVPFYGYPRNNISNDFENLFKYCIIALNVTIGLKAKKPTRTTRFFLHLNTIYFLFWDYKYLYFKN